MASTLVGPFKKRAMGEAMDDLRRFDVAMLTVFMSRRGLRQNAASRDSFICSAKPYFKYGALYRRNTHALESVDAPEGGSVWEAAGQAVWLHSGLPNPGVGTSGMRLGLRGQRSIAPEGALSGCPFFRPARGAVYFTRRRKRRRRCLDNPRSSLRAYRRTGSEAACRPAP